MNSKKPIHAPGVSLGQVLVPLPGPPHQVKSHNSYSEDLVLPHAGSPAVSPQSMSSPYLGSADSGFPIMVLTPFVHKICPPSLQLNSRSSAQCLAVDHCICFHQLLDVSSMMTRQSLIRLKEKAQSDTLFIIAES